MSYAACVKLNKNMSEAKNLACPFCGGKARVICRGYQDGGKWTDWVSVTCPATEGGCGASQSATTEEAAWKLWNTRAGGRSPATSKTPEPSTLASANGSASLPKHIWADCDPDAPAHIRWAFYRSKADQRGNRPDLKAIKLRVSLA